jgi:hypothetical protein
MELWDEDYFNMEVQAYIQIKSNGIGEFQFGLVSGQIDGEIANEGNQERFVFEGDVVENLHFSVLAISEGFLKKLPLGSDL